MCSGDLTLIPARQRQCPHHILNLLAQKNHALVCTNTNRLLLGLGCCVCFRNDVSVPSQPSSSIKTSICVSCILRLVGFRVAHYFPSRFYTREKNLPTVFFSRGNTMESEYKSCQHETSSFAANVPNKKYKNITKTMASTYNRKPLWRRLSFYTRVSCWGVMPVAGGQVESNEIHVSEPDDANAKQFHRFQSSAPFSSFFSLTKKLKEKVETSKYSSLKFFWVLQIVPSTLSGSVCSNACLNTDKAGQKR